MRRKEHAYTKTHKALAYLADDFLDYRFVHEDDRGRFGGDHARYDIHADARLLDSGVTTCE